MANGRMTDCRKQSSIASAKKNGTAKKLTPIDEKVEDLNLEHKSKLNKRRPSRVKFHSAY